MLSNIVNTPFFKVLLPFVIGILLSEVLPISLGILSLLSIFLSFVLLLVFFALKELNSIKQFYYNFTLIVFLIICGHQLSITQNIRTSAYFLQNQQNTPAYCTAVVEEQFKEKEKVYIGVLALQTFIDSAENVSPAIGKLYASIKKDSSISIPQKGDLILFPAKLHLLKVPTNPYAFDFSAMSARKDIYHNTYMQANQYIIIKKAHEKNILFYANTIRNEALEVFKRYNLEGEEFAILAALMLGYKDELTAELVESYANAGAMHVLAVSGLHVGIIYTLLSFLLPFSKHKRWQRITKALILILFLWAYAFITGLSPSVMRAATMFSFVAIGQSLLRPSNIYNVLFASAFLLLLIDTQLLFHVGFQLSYIAVIGIVYLQPKINNWFEPKNKVLRWAWALTSVSIAAQIATFAIGMFYFNKYSTYFFITNLFIIPAAGGIIYGGLCLLFLSLFPFLNELAMLVAFLLKYLVWLVNFLVNAMEILPYSAFSNISLNAMEVLLIFTVIIYFLLYFEMPYFSRLRNALVLILVFVGVRSYQHFYYAQQSTLVIYDNATWPTLGIKSNNSEYIFSAADSINPFITKAYQTKYRIRQSEILPMHTSISATNFMKHENCIAFENHKLLIIDKLINADSSLANFDVIYLINNAALAVPDCIKYLKKEALIICDGSSYPQKREEWKRAFESANFNFHDIKTEGAFVFGSLKKS